ILIRNRVNDPIDDLYPVLSTEEIVQLQQDVMAVKLSGVVMDYLLGIVRQTREHSDIELGVSSRAALALMRAAQARACLHERMYITPQDVKVLASYVLEHRIVLSMEGSIRKTRHDVMKEILSAVDVPVELGTDS